MISPKEYEEIVNKSLELAEKERDNIGLSRGLDAGKMFLKERTEFHIKNMLGSETE